MLLHYFAVFFVFNIKDFEGKGKPEILKKSSKTRGSIYSHFRSSNNEEHALFQAGNRQLSQKFPE